MNPEFPTPPLRRERGLGGEGNSTTNIPIYIPIESKEERFSMEIYFSYTACAFPSPPAPLLKERGAGG